MIAQQIPRLGQCIETPSGEGIVNAIHELRNGDYLILIANFAEKTIERLTAMEWNEYLDLTGMFQDLE